MQHALQTGTTPLEEGLKAFRGLCGARAENRVALKPAREDQPFGRGLREGIRLIEVTRLNGLKYWLNPHLIETIERKPDTTVALVSGKTLVVKESPERVIEEIVEYRRRLGGPGNEK